MSDTLSLGESLPLEQARVRELITIYRSIGPAGFLGAALMEAALRRADAAVMSGDVVAMITAHEDLKGFEE